MKKLLLTALVLIGLTSCKREPDTQNVVTLKVVYLDGRIDTIRANGKFCGMYISEGYSKFQNYLSISGDQVAFDVKSASIIKEETVSKK